jgi:sugar/nucleoside kinase (ribokinase family)
MSYFLQRSLQAGLPDLLEEARRNGATTSLDTNWDPDERWADGVRDALRSVDTFLPNEAEALALTGAESVTSAAKKLSEIIPDVVIKRGPRGAYAISDGEVHDVPAMPIDVRDTTGAGDSFDAGYVYGQLAGMPTRKRLRAACICGALSTRGLGGVATQATEAELFAALEEEPPA